MASADLKHSIKSALADFQARNLSQNAIALFDALGYNVTRQQPFEQKTYAYFNEYYVGSKNFNTETAKVTKWQSIDLLFQLSKDEVSDQHTLFNTHQVEQTIIESYLFFALELKPAAYSRTDLAQMTREINKVFPMPVMILFKHGDNITLSVINRRLHKKDAQKDVLEKVTLIKDIALENPHRAHIDILSDLSLTEIRRVYKVNNFVELHNAWQKVLDTKQLNKKFYKELSNWYFWAIKEVVFPIASFDADDVFNETQNDKLREHNAKNLIRLLTRILFVWFIKEKDLIPDELFDESYIKTHLIKDFDPHKEKNYNPATQRSEYYRAILQNLFFATLNQTVGKRKFRNSGQNRNVTNLMRYESYFKDPQAFLNLVEDKVPFMNGGLFECLDRPDPHLKGKQGGDVILYEDGFSDRPDNVLRVPDYIFFDDTQRADLSEELGDKKQKDVEIKGLINILKAYKFTVTENTPIEEDIALDPELLGQVFENLLASYNPETKTTARKQTGSFYTPREIVDYMVDESLIAYLENENGVQRALPVAVSTEQTATGKAFCTPDKLRILLSYNDLPNPFNATETTRLINAIDNCKILDPACGSGAFPMGILHKLVHCLHKLDPKNQRWQERQLEKARTIDDVTLRDSLIEDIEAAFTNNELDYGRKLYLIENCIYGVDIQPIATQISKLRFFISLIVDQKSDRNKDNFGIRPLPNLETKFVAANTLIGIQTPKSGDTLGSPFDNPEVKNLEERLKEVCHRLFSAKTPATKRKLREEDAVLREKIAGLLQENGCSNQTAQQLVSWNPYDQNTGSPFFDSEWMFGISDGFDVVIGNPPYGAELINSDIQYFKKNYVLKTSETAILFIEKGYNLLNKDGIQSYIIPKSFTFSSNYSTARDFVEKGLLVIADCGKSFENVKLEACVILLRKKISYEYKSVKFENDLSFKLIGVIEKRLKRLFDFYPNGIEIKEIELGEKILKKSIMLNAISNNSRGGMLQKYVSNWGTHAIIGGKEIDKYGIRGIKGYIDNINMINEKANIHANSILVQNIIAHVTKPYDHIKIIACIPSQQDIALVDTINQITITSFGFSNSFIWALLNSKLLNWYAYLFIFAKAIRTMHFDNAVTARIPLPQAEIGEKNAIEKLADYILFVTKQPFYKAIDLAYAEERLMVNFFENLIDALVYELYFPDELHEAGKYFISLLEKENLPDLNAIQGDKISTLKQIIKRLTDKNHPLYVNLFFLDSVPVVRIIEGKA
jgi:hypothetical protein